MSNTNTARVDLHLPSKHELKFELIDENKNHPIPAYIMIGRDGRSRHKLSGVDVPSRLKKLSSNSHWLFWSLVELRDHETNLVKPKHLTNLNAKERGRIPRAYKELEREGLVVRSTKQTYLINPKVVLPAPKFFTRTWEEWTRIRNQKGLAPT